MKTSHILTEEEKELLDSGDYHQGLCMRAIEEGECDCGLEDVISQIASQRYEQGAVDELVSVMAMVEKGTWIIDYGKLADRLARFEKDPSLTEKK